MSFGTVGMKDLGKAALEFPAGVEPGGLNIPIAPADRARLRYNNVTKTVQLSVDLGPYADVTTGGGGASPWTEVGGVVRLQDITDDVVVGATTMSGTEKFRVVGGVLANVPDNDASALLVAEGANSYLAIDTTDLAEVITLGNATTNPTVTVVGSGDVVLGTGALVFPERAADPGGTLNQGKTYTKDVAGITELFYQDSAGNVVQITTGGLISASTDIVIPDNTANAFRVREGANDYINIDTTDTAELMVFGNLTVPISVRVDVVNNTDNAFLLRSSAGVNHIEIDTTTGGAGRLSKFGHTTGNGSTVLQGRDGAGTTSSVIIGTGDAAVRNFIRIDGLTDGVLTLGQNGDIHVLNTVIDNRASAFTIGVSGTGKIRFDTFTGANVFNFGVGAASGFQVLMDYVGSLQLNAGCVLAMVESAADPGGTANQGKLYTKDVAGVTELFYQRSDGTTLQLS